MKPANGKTIHIHTVERILTIRAVTFLPAGLIVLQTTTASGAAAELAGPERYAQEPVLLETFVEKQRFKGTCYKAANWVEVGETQGRGKLDTEHKNALPVKKIFLYPLQRTFRQALCSA